MKIVYRYCGLQLLLGVMLTVSACQTQVTPAPTSSAPPKGPVITTAPATTAAPTAAPAAAAPATAPTKVAVKQEGELRIAEGGLGREVMNPLISPGAQYPGMALFDHLLWFKSDSTAAPGLAESWQQAPDGLSWTFKIRKGVKFHNGDDLTAEDARFSLMAFSQKLQGTPAVTASNSGKLKALVSDVVVVDPYTVRVVTTERSDDFLKFVAPLSNAIEGIVMPKGYVEKVGWDEFNKKPIGSGPWKLADFKTGSHVTYEAQAEHWRYIPPWKKLTIYVVPEAGSRIGMLRNGEVDLLLLSGDQVKEVEGYGFPMARSEGSTGTGFIVVRDLSNRLPTTNVRVREALSLAVDREEIVKHVMAGEAAVPIYPTGVTDLDTTVDLKSLPKFESNAAKAKQLLAEAGYPTGFSVDLISHQAVQQGDAIGRVIADQWGKLGIKTNVVSMDYQALLTALRKVPPDPKIQGQVALFPSSTERDLLDRMTSFYHSTKGNLHFIDTPEMDALIDAAVNEKESAKRMPLTTKAITYVHNQFAENRVVINKAAFALSKKLQPGWQITRRTFFIYQLESLQKAS